MLTVTPHISGPQLAAANRALKPLGVRIERTRESRYQKALRLLATPGAVSERERTAAEVIYQVNGDEGVYFVTLLLSNGSGVCTCVNPSCCSHYEAARMAEGFGRLP